MTSKSFTRLGQYLQQSATLGSISALVSWDQETYMPGGGGEARSDQQALLAGLLHARNTSSELGDLIAACEEDPGVQEDDAQSANLREVRRDFERATRLPAELVTRLAKLGSQSQEAWKAARADSDFARFAPFMEEMLQLTRRKAECYGVPQGGAELYDALLDVYEPGATAAGIESILGPLKCRLAALIADVAESAEAPDESPLDVVCDATRQHAFGEQVLKSMGFDLSAGRLDTTAHPFCTGIAPGDTRLTTRYEGRFTEALYGSMHEGGHGIYEQGLPKQTQFGWPSSEAVSLGMHESQSRLWENLVGRSREFWTWALPHARELLSDEFAAFSVEDMYRAVNTAKPSLIRVEADESTYNLHVMLRFELERALLSGDLAVQDLPGAWNEKVRESLGLEVPNDAEGCLQDVHWAFGLMGYFPTYCLGNLYAAQFWESILEDLPELPGSIARGEFGALRGWLNERVHAHGRRYSAAQLCERATGKSLSADPMMRYLEGKLRPIYSL